MAADARRRRGRPEASTSRFCGRVLQFARPYRRSFLASVALLLVLAASSLLVPLVIRHTIDHYFPPSGAARRRRGSGARDRPRSGVALAAAALLVLGVLLSAARFAQIRVINTTGQRVIHDLRMAVFRHITTRSLRFFDKSPVGRLVTRTTHDVESLNELFISGIDVVFYDLLRIVVIIVVLFAVDWRMALATLGVIPLIAIHSFWFQRQARRLFRVGAREDHGTQHVPERVDHRDPGHPGVPPREGRAATVRGEEPRAQGRAPPDGQELQPLLSRHGVPLGRRHGRHRLPRERALLRRRDRPRRPRDVLDAVQHVHRAAAAARGQVQRPAGGARRGRAHLPHPRRRPRAADRGAPGAARTGPRPHPVRERELQLRRREAGAPRRLVRGPSGRKGRARRPDRAPASRRS